MTALATFIAVLVVLFAVVAVILVVLRFGGR